MIMAVNVILYYFIKHGSKLATPKELTKSTSIIAQTDDEKAKVTKYNL